MWGKVLAWAERSGRPIPAVDGLIAATGLAFDFTVATRNVSDMDVEGLAVFNPWGGDIRIAERRTDFSKV